MSAKNTHSGHDHGYKRLFSHPQAVEELIRGFLRPEWVEGIDFSTLERVGNEFISDDLRERHSDVIWRMRRKGKWLYLLLELQSTSHPFMALRMLTYAGLLLEETLRKEKLRSGSRLPTVLPVVLYNGKGPWRPPLDLASLFETEESLRRHLPRLRYLLLDQGRLDLDRPELAGNRVAALFRIETCKNLGDLPHLARELFRLLPPGKEPELHQTFMILLRAMLRRTLPGVTISEIVGLEDTSMLEETAREWRKQYVKEGRQEGMHELLLRQIERRFGPLPSEQRRRFEAITSPARLKRLADKILTAGSLDEMGI